MDVSRTPMMLVATLIGLALATWLAGCPCCGGGAASNTTISPGSGSNSGGVDEETERDLAVLWFNGFDGSGGYSDVRVTVAPHEGESAKVSFAEGEVGGSGDMWEAAGWMAACVSSLATGVPMNTYSVEYAVEGAIDGPSAGGLFTVAVLSALTSADLSDDVTMTGTVNPDGTIGPVGGIPHKLEGAADAGRTKVLVPVGQREDLDLSGSEPFMVDLIRRGEELGIEVVQVATVAEAYQEFTDEELDWAPAVASVPEPPVESMDRVRDAAIEWLQRAEEYEAACYQIDEAVLQELEAEIGLMTAGAQSWNEADQHLRAGSSAAAYDSAVESAAYFLMVAKLVQVVVDTIDEGESVDALARVVSREMASGALVDEYLAELAGREPTTVTQAIALADAYAVGMEAIGLLQQAGEFEAELQALDQADQDRAFELLGSLAIIYGVLDAFLDYAQDRIAIGWDLPGPDLAGDTDIQAWTSTMKNAADANVAYFDSVVLEDMAANEGAAPAAFKQAFALFDWDYAFAIGARHARDVIAQDLGEDTPEATWATLGLSIGSFARSSALVAKYYSLGAEYDPTTGTTILSRRAALSAVLDEAENRAGAYLAEAEALGADTTIPYAYYRVGKTYRDYTGGDDTMKLSALESLWKASTYARLMVLLAED
ncbi:MAG: hypothetical protein GF320_11610 [Armatimonadia bacterium]|nr:hypothetical protein [Armatimonadia bacterium]